MIIYGFSIAMFNHQIVYPDGVEDKHDDFTMVICDPIAPSGKWYDSRDLELRDFQIQIQPLQFLILFNP